MHEQPQARKRRLANERALYRYSQALERGDIETIALLLQEASHNEELEGMIYAMHDSDQPIESLPDFSQPNQQHSTVATYLSQPAEHSRVKHPARQRRVYMRLQALAAVLVVLVLITGSVLLFHSLRSTRNAATNSPTPVPTKAVLTPQGMIVMLFTDGHIRAVRGVTGQTLWSYKITQGTLGDPNLPFYSGLIVQGHRVYVMARNHIYVLNEDTGRLLWQKVFPVHFANVTPNVSHIEVDADIVYASIQGNTQGAVYALRASDGHQLWQATSSGYGLNSPLLAASGGIAYIAIENATTYQVTVEARRGTDGSSLWSHPSTGEVSFAAVANKVLYVYAFPGAVPPGDGKLNKQLLALNASNGHLLWSRGVSYGNYTTPIIYAQGTLLVDNGPELCVHSASNGAPLWCIPESFDIANATGDDVVSYVAGPDELYIALVSQAATPVSQTSYNVQYHLQVKALDYHTGQVLWTNQTLVYDNSHSSLTLSLAPLQQNTLLVSNSSPLVTGLDADTGHTLWHINGSAPPEILQIAATR